MVKVNALCQLTSGVDCSSFMIKYPDVFVIFVQKVTLQHDAARYTIDEHMMLRWNLSAYLFEEIWAHSFNWTHIVVKKGRIHVRFICANSRTIL